ncbi:hypothetical protein MRX96_055590 [Rhipicephalus microplus]
MTSAQVKASKSSSWNSKMAATCNFGTSLGSDSGPLHCEIIERRHLVQAPRDRRQGPQRSRTLKVQCWEWKAAKGQNKKVHNYDVTNSVGATEDNVDW